jgi:phenylalanyl-tRNA synthetase beta chain
MRIPISWLSEYVDLELGVDELAERLTSAGMEVTKIEHYGLAGASLEWDPELVRVARLLEVRPHPDADRLVLATVDYGGDTTKVVVTGAPNLFPLLDEGDVSGRELYSPILLEGAHYLDPHEGGKPTRLVGRKLRGIHNDAMLASEAELGLCDAHEGVILMTAGDGEGLAPLTPGRPLRDVLGDAVLDVDIIPNIARCASIVGIAREVAALTRKQLRLPSTEVCMEGAPLAGRVEIRTESPELNPRFVALLIEGVEQKPAPYWMQHRLRLAGQRPINVVVDVSNYVMLEIGQPNHTFDYDFLRRRADRYAPDGPIRIVTRLARARETLTTLDGAVHELRPNNILVTDPEGSLSLGGLMGGLASEITPATTNVLLEAAAWNFLNIRQSSRQLGLQTEASFRFSRGVHPSQALLGAQRAAELLRRHAGGTVAEGVVDFYPNPPPPVTVDLDPAYVRRLSGLDLPIAAMADLLERLELTVEEQDGRLEVAVPDHRLDVEGPHDLVEEICRLHGYDRIPTTALSDVLPPQRGNPSLEREERLRDVLAGLGLQEVITHRLTTPEAEAKLFGEQDTRPYVRLAKPSTAERAVLRHSLLASVLEIAASNSRFQEQVGIFELGAVFLKEEGRELPAEPPRLALVLTGPCRLPHWQEAEPPRRVDFFDLKGVLESLFADVRVAVRFETGEHRSFRPGRTAAVRLGEHGEALGVLGELHPLVVERYELRLEREQPVLAAELELAPLLPQIPDTFQVVPLPAYPAVREDLALVVDAETPAAAVETALRAAGGELLEDVELFDVYTGEKVGAAKKSLAYHLVFRSPNKTLTDGDTAKLRRRILQRLERELGARLRE